MWPWDKYFLTCRYAINYPDVDYGARVEFKLWLCNYFVCISNNKRRIK